nr:hypothetical protein [uncultured Leptotrichia sp.]
MFGNKKSFNEGIKNGIRLSEEIVRRDTDALSKMHEKLENISGDTRELKESVEEVIKNQETFEIEKLFGIIRTLSPDDLEKEEKIILLQILVDISKRYESNNNQKEFLRNLILYFEINSEDSLKENDFKSTIDNIDSKKVEKIMYKIIKEYLYLENDNNNYGNKYDEYLSLFVNGVVDNKNIENEIELKVVIFGKEILYQQFSKYSYNFEENKEYTYEDFEAKDENIAYENLYINNIIQIKIDEIKEISHKNVYINSYINCNGTLKFKKCIIYYNETNEVNEILLSKNANLFIENCTIICRKINGDMFIKAPENTKVEIRNSKFLDCSHFLEVGEYYSLQNKTIIDNCNIINCSDDFLFIYGNCEFTNNVIVQDRKIKGSGIPTFTYNNIFICNNKESERNLISNNKFRDNRVNKEFSRIYLAVNNAKIINCDFKDINKNDGRFSLPIIRMDNVEVEDCKFENCKNILFDNFVTKEKIIIDNCKFENCTNVLKMTHNECFLSNTKFISCYDNVIEYNGGIIEFCEFIDVKEEMNIGIPENYILLNGKEISTIRNCIFDDIKLRSYLINYYNIEKEKDIMTSDIRNCIFKNYEITEENGLINKFFLYKSFWGELQRKQVIQTYTCKGL